MRLGPLFEAYGFRTVSRDYSEEIEGSASAEYLRGDLALRLTWDGASRALWIEAARSTGGSIISRWTDIEWVSAGERRPLDTDVDDARLDRLAVALRAFLEGGPGDAP